MRKTNIDGGIGLITQSGKDLENPGILDLLDEICPTKILRANPGADHAGYQWMVYLNEKEVELFSELIPSRQFLQKIETRAKVLNVDLDRHAYWEYKNSPNDNGRRQAAIAEYGFEVGLGVLATQAVKEGTTNDGIERHFKTSRIRMHTEALVERTRARQDALRNEPRRCN